MTQHDFDPEKLRPAEHIQEPDPRNALIAWPDAATGVLRPVKATYLHDAVSAFSLRAGVPEDIVQHFETVKNVYHYSWFVYRFIVWLVSDLHCARDRRTRSGRERSVIKDPGYTV